MADLICPIAQWAEKDPNHPAIWKSHKPTTYRELNQLVSVAENALQKRGIGYGDRIAVRLPVSTELIAIFSALNRIGAIALLLSERDRSAVHNEQIESLTCRAVVHNSIYDGPEEPVRYIHSSTLFRSAEPGTKSIGTISPGSPAAAVFTSGSLGKPKAALLSYGNLYYNALGSNENISFGPDDRWLVGLPLYHVGGLGILFRAFIGGGSVVLPEPGFDLARQIAMHHITHISVVNKQLYDLVNLDGEFSGAHTLKAVLVGGSAISTKLIGRALNAGFPIHTSYGLTEMASQVTTTSVQDRVDGVHSSGKVLRYRQIRIVDGEILVRGECQFQGYLTGTGVERAIGTNDWFHTRDLGTINDQGYLTVQGRMDNMFISGGENIQPEEIERILLNMPQVQEAMVVPVDDEEYGDRPVAFIQSSPGTNLDEEAIRQSLRESLPGFKIPIRIFPYLPPEHVTSMKFSRKEFRALAMDLLRNRR
jgi:o-succinylbenzoate---CoA ligase